MSRFRLGLSTRFGGSVGVDPKERRSERGRAPHVANHPTVTYRFFCESTLHVGITLAILVGIAIDEPGCVAAGDVKALAPKTRAVTKELFTVFMPPLSPGCMSLKIRSFLPRKPGKTH